MLGDHGSVELGRESIDSLLADLGATKRPQWGRWAVDRDGDKWRLRYAEVTIGAAPPGYASRKWVYPNHVFLEQRTTLNQLGAALRGRRVRVCGFRFMSLDLHDSASSTRLQSSADYGGHRLPWPVTRFEFSAKQPVSASGGSEPLISTKSPSFAYYEAAMGAYFRPENGGRWQQNSAVVVNVADVGVRIGPLTIKSGEIHVEIEGNDARGCAVQLTSAGRSVTRVVDGAQTVLFPLPEPFVDDLFVVLADERWRDMRLISPPGRPSAADPTIVWEDPALELDVLVSSGEGQNVEFKSALPTKERDSIRKAIKGVPAFANSLGGVLIYGITDQGELVGLNDHTAAQATDRLNNLVHDNVYPVPSFRIECQERDGKLLALLKVDSGAEKPYAMFRSPPQFYVRHGATSYPATREEILAMAAREDSSYGYRFAR